MSGSLRPVKIALLGIAAILLLCHPRFSGASTLKVESEDDDAAMSAPPKGTHPSMKASRASVWESDGEKGVRTGDEIGFDYFVLAGFGVSNRSEVSPVGLVGNSASDGDYVNLGDKVYVDFFDGSKISKGDDLVIYRFGSIAGFPGATQSDDWVRNLGVARVLEVADGKCLVKITRLYELIRKGDYVKPFADEETRWRGAHVRKSLPNGPVSCWVADGIPGEKIWTRSDTILLTAGTKQGVVEGQVFELTGSDEAISGNETAWTSQGTAKVFYAGPDFSTAQITRARESVRKGFAAVYQP